MPNEVPNPIRFSQDRTHAAYDAAAAHRFWRALVQADRIFKLFRSGFIGKASPVHFFWGSFDLAVTRFSGRPAPPHPGGVPGLPDDVAREAYSHEVSSAGFWPGNEAFPRAAFYSYAYPEPAGFRDRKTRELLQKPNAWRVHPSLRHGCASGLPGRLAARLFVDNLRGGSRRGSLGPQRSWTSAWDSRPGANRFKKRGTALRRFDPPISPHKGNVQPPPPAPPLRSLLMAFLHSRR